MTRLASVTAALLAFAFASPATAAAEYEVTACGDAPERSQGAWAVAVSSPGTVESAQACGQPGDHGGLAIREILHAPSLAVTGDSGWWTFAASTGTRIETLSISYWLRSFADPSWRGDSGGRCHA